MGCGFTEYTFKVQVMFLILEGENLFLHISKDIKILFLYERKNRAVSMLYLVVLLNLNKLRNIIVQRVFPSGKYLYF